MNSKTQLAQRYASLFVNPFVILKVTNRRVFVFKGDFGVVVELNNSPTSLPEVLAKSGGLAKNLKAYKIKILRGDMANPQVRIVDLSTLEGLRTADLTLQANDIIYVQQRRQVTADLAQQILPFVSVMTLITSIAFLARTSK